LAVITQTFICETLDSFGNVILNELGNPSLMPVWKQDSDATAYATETDFWNWYRTGANYEPSGDGKPAYDPAFPGKVENRPPFLTEEFPDFNGLELILIGDMVNDPTNPLSIHSLYWTWDATNALLIGDFTAYLNSVKGPNKTEIDETAEQTRLKYITDGAGQSNTYAEKANQAQKYVDLGTDPDPAGAGFELVQAEADALTNAGTVTTPRQAADMILATRTTWLILAADIERERRQGKLKIDGAPTAGDVIVEKDIAIAALNLI